MGWVAESSSASALGDDFSCYRLPVPELWIYFSVCSIYKLSGRPRFDMLKVGTEYFFFFLAKMLMCIGGANNVLKINKKNLL